MKFSLLISKKQLTKNHVPIVAWQKLNISINYFFVVRNNFKKNPKIMLNVKENLFFAHQQTRTCATRQQKKLIHT